MELGERRFTRRDLAKSAAKFGAAGAAVVFVAPHFEDIAYAAGSTGSPPPDTTTTTKKHTGGGPEYPTCQGDPRVFFDLPHSVRVWGSGWAPSSKITVTLVGVKTLGTITVSPNGKFDVTYKLPAGLHADQLYRISFSGRGKNGHPYKCGVAIFIDQRCKGAVIVAKSNKTNTAHPIAVPKAKSGGVAGGDGVDARSVVLVGAGALIAGKSLYSLRNRVAAAADGDLALH